MKNTAQQSTPHRRSGKYWLLPVVVVVCVVLVRRFAFDVIRIDTDAMTPALHKEQWVVINKLKSPSIGDIVLFYPAKVRPEASLPKYSLARVAALSGDSIHVSGGCIRVNGRELSYPLHIPRGQSYALRLPTPHRAYRLDYINLVAVREAIRYELGREISTEGGELSVDGRTRSHFTFRHHYTWLLTDVSTQGPDSRHIGIVNRKHIVGVVLLPEKTNALSYAACFGICPTR